MAKQSTVWTPNTGTGEVTTDNDGVDRLTEDGTTRLTQAGTVRELESAVITPKTGTTWEESDS